jgi:hypothetical protein
MSSPEDDLLPVTIRCPFCNARMDLDDEERALKTFECPACHRIIDFRSTPSQLQGMLALMGKKKNNN